MHTPGNMRVMCLGSQNGGVFEAEKAFCGFVIIEVSRSETIYFIIFLYVLLMLQLQDNTDNFIVQLDGAPPHWSANMRDYLDQGRR
ncbi:hypothetical protein TNCV_4953661 [Trichonephila clavipes]|nr:hypothetical protein TNCV_4953661 [Trichonephila clavipes]